ncbi:MAG: carboxypeptidase regulatory-like domain-containing protein, partial [Cellulomonas sp.]|nr:carboxypeptidase regulatory-like domain-containing protein [Cellulomonas sp.]
GVSVVATDGQHSWTTTSTAAAGTPAGYYSFVQLPPGSYSVSVSQGGVVVSTAVVSVTAGGTVSQDLSLPGAG